MNPIAPTFAERPLEDTQRTFEALIAKGLVIATRTTADDLARARLPAHTGPTFAALARAYRTLRLRDSDVTFQLHDGAPADDALGGWRLCAEPEEVDVRIATRGVVSDDVVVDATWSPRHDDVAVHSTFVHFIVRSTVGDAQ
jgi:hypothetical protein